MPIKSLHTYYTLFDLKIINFEILFSRYELLLVKLINAYS